MTLPDKSLARAFQRQALERPTEPALWDGEKKEFVNWRDLYDGAMALGDALVRRSAAIPGQVVWIGHTVSNRNEDVLVALACLLWGMVEVPVDASGGDSYIEACRGRSGAFWLDESTKSEWVEQTFNTRNKVAVAGRLATRLSNRASDRSDDAMVLWTSGSSGEPKGVVLSRHSLTINAAAKLKAVPQHSSDLRLTVLSIAHAYARTCDLGTWLLSGCRWAISLGFEGWTDWANAMKPTHCNTVPSLAERMLLQSGVPNSLRLLGCGGAALDTDLFAHWNERGVTVIQGYGLTEAGPVVSSQTPADSIAGHAGRFVDGWRYRICDGRLSVRGGHQMSRYLDDPDATSQRVDTKGWLDTGDLVEISGDSGQLRILGRADDRIVLSNGHVVDPLAVESRLARVPGIATAVVAESADGRGIQWWLEPSDSADALPALQTIVDSLPNWEKPRAIRSFQVPLAHRGEVFTRKGTVRRKPMLRLLHRSDSFRDHT